MNMQTVSVPVSHIGIPIDGCHYTYTYVFELSLGKSITSLRLSDIELQAVTIYMTPGAKKYGYSKHPENTRGREFLNVYTAENQSTTINLTLKSNRYHEPMPNLEFDIVDYYPYKDDDYKSVISEIIPFTKPLHFVV